MKPSLSAWAKRNHGQKAIASTGKDLRTGLETFWYDCMKTVAHERRRDQGADPRLHDFGIAARLRGRFSYRASVSRHRHDRFHAGHVDGNDDVASSGDHAFY